MKKILYRIPLKQVLRDPDTELTLKIIGIRIMLYNPRFDGGGGVDFIHLFLQIIFTAKTIHFQGV